MKKPISILALFTDRLFSGSIKAGILLLLFYICLGSKMLLAMPDSVSFSTQRIPKKSTIEKYHTDPEFDYREKPRGDSLWNKFMRWLFSRLKVKPGSYADTFLTRDLWYIVFALVLIAAIYTFFKSDIQGLFYKSPAAQVKMHVLEEDIHTLNFDGLIEEAVRKQNYRYAIRLSYLKNLKELNDRGLIDWKGHKTNFDYLQELKGKNVYSAFSSVTQLFNWIWYGDFSLNEEEYRQFQTEFVQFSRQIAAKA